MSEDEFDIDPEDVEEFIETSKEELEQISSNFVEYEKDPSNQELINTIFRDVHSIKGSCDMLNLMGLRKYLHEIESTLQDIRDGKLSYNPDMGDVLLKGLDKVNGFLDHLAENNAEDPELVLATNDIKSQLDAYKQGS